MCGAWLQEIRLECLGQPLPSTTAVHIFHEFCSALTRLSRIYIKFPRTPIEIGKAIQLFNDDVNCKIPQAFAAVDGTHIEIMAPDFRIFGIILGILFGYRDFQALLVSDIIKKRKRLYLEKENRF